MPRFSARRDPVTCALALTISILLAGCGGGGGGAEAAVVPPFVPPTSPPPPTQPPAPTPPPPPATGFDPALDPVLANLARQADAAALAPVPTQDPALVELGRSLFFDRELSGNRDVSCYTCHDVDAASGDGLSVSIGTGGFGKAAARALRDGRLIARNAPPLFHLAGRRTLFWDGRVSRRPDGTFVTPEPALNGPTPSAATIVAALPSALAAQALFPVTSADEMRGQPGENELADAPDAVTLWALLMRRLVGTDDGAHAGITGYRDLFARAYPAVGRWDDFTFGHAAAAIAAFEISAFETRRAPFDRWILGDPAALSAPEKRGGILFYGRAACARCHGGPTFSDDRFHAIGVPQVGPGKDFAIEDTGRALVTGDANDRYRFRTPSLRNVEITGPWMHDGAYTTLGAVVRHYVDPEASLRGYDASQLSPLLRFLVDANPARQDARALAIDSLVRGGVRLNPGEIADLTAFLRTLTDDDAAAIGAAEPETVPSGLPIDDEEADE